MSPRGPRQRPGLWARIKYRIYWWHSPLELRASLVRLRHHHKHPILTLLGLFFPFPSWYFPVPKPVSPRALIDDTTHGTNIIINSRHSDIVNLRSIPLWSARDTPLQSMHRLYELHLAGRSPLIGTETEYFFYHEDWKLGDIPDPKDEDPIRYAFLASFMEELHEAVNWRLSLGLRRNRQKILRQKGSDPWPPFTPETLPDWTRTVPPIDEDFLKRSVPSRMVDVEGNLVLEEDGKGQHFARRNIVTNTDWLYTI